MNKAIKYRLYPNAEQENLINRTFGCCRKIYNLLLEDKISYYNSTGKMLYNTPAQYKKDYPYLTEVDSLALANVQLNLQKAYNAFFKNPKAGFSKFKSNKRSRRAYTTNNQNGTICLTMNAIKLPKLGMVKAKIHRTPLTGWRLKSATVSQDSDKKYYVSCLFEFDEIVYPKTISEETTLGLDYKSDGLYTDSNGKTCGMPHYYRKSQKKLAKEQRKLKHKVIGSNNYYKQQEQIAKVYRHISNQRKDFLHKESTAITKQYSCVCVESLNMKAMSNRGFGNGKATLENGYGIFLDMLAYKLQSAGGLLVKVDKWYPSSQLCHSCGCLHPEMKDLSIRTIICECGYVCDRDYNAAKNIKTEGLSMLTA